MYLKKAITVFNYFYFAFDLFAYSMTTLITCHCPKLLENLLDFHSVEEGDTQLESGNYGKSFCVSLPYPMPSSQPY